MSSAESTGPDHDSSYIDAEGSERCTDCDKWLEPPYYTIEDHHAAALRSNQLSSEDGTILIDVTCPYCQRLLTVREATEQAACDDCNAQKTLGRPGGRQELTDER